MYTNLPSKQMIKFSYKLFDQTWVNVNTLELMEHNTCDNEIDDGQEWSRIKATLSNKKSGFIFFPFPLQLWKVEEFFITLVIPGDLKSLLDWRLSYWIIIIQTFSSHL